jgi:hypothetical protein
MTFLPFLDENSSTFQLFFNQSELNYEAGSHLYSYPMIMRAIHTALKLLADRNDLKTVLDLFVFYSGVLRTYIKSFLPLKIMESFLKDSFCQIKGKRAKFITKPF